MTSHATLGRLRGHDEDDDDDDDNTKVVDEFSNGQSEIVYLYK